MADQDDGRNSPAQKADDDEKKQAAGATAAAGLGCLSVAAMPWIVVVLVLVIIAIAWIVGKSMQGG